MRRSAALLLFALPVGLGSAFAAAPPASALAPSPSGPVLVAGQTQTLEAAAALQAGYTLIDLTNDWTPFIFEEMKDANGAPLPNRYRSVYLGLANDTGDGDGQPLSPGEHNYLELYGIEPTFAVLRARFLDDEAHQSCKDIDYDKLKAANSIPLRSPQAEARMASKIRAERRGLETKRRRAHLATLDALAAADPQSAKLVAEVERYAAERLAFPVAEKRLACEHLFPAHEKHARGKFDEAMREAVIRFQHKEKLYDSPSLRPSTMDALARTPLENDYQAFVRVLTERVVSGADILEAAGAKPGRRDGAGHAQAARNRRARGRARLFQEPPRRGFQIPHHRGEAAGAPRILLARYGSFGGGRSRRRDLRPAVR